jgi:hypothetical protein
VYQFSAKVARVVSFMDILMVKSVLWSFAIDSDTIHEKAHRNDMKSARAQFTIKI